MQRPNDRTHAPRRPAVFLDRDDTLIRCNDLPAAPPPAAPGDLVDPDVVELLPGVREACGLLQAAGFTLLVVSNQGSVARGAADIALVERVNARARMLLHPFVAAFYFCPFHPKGAPGGTYTREHHWRKPGAGMLHAAAEELGLDLAASWLIGDAQRDLEAGILAGLEPGRCLRVGPGHRSILDAAALVAGRG